MLIVLGILLQVAVLSKGFPVNNRPIIGVLAQESFKGAPAATYIPTPYIKWLESAGARVVPVRLFRENDAKAVSYYKNLFGFINGILFPGGGVDILKSQFAKTAMIFYDLAITEKNKCGDLFPIWGTCQGFELISALVSKQNLLTSVDAENLPLPLNFTPEAARSSMFGSLPEDVYKPLKTENVTANYHHWGLTPTNFSQNKDLRSVMKVLSTNTDRNGKEFISSMEVPPVCIVITKYGGSSRSKDASSGAVLYKPIGTQCMLFSGTQKRIILCGWQKRT
ncbi:gamma-glutamyl hydrolase-like isoform X2 [Ostrea edulis]|uniref:gamma-glutamyl hydrolase-like isoform X2 n=1 Tax=Ostrea edulis TaxID=37623 RepID=UPI0024AEC0B6|nr:gamma-glutamyl hydrolase-like isoform X2 [Ostrea edulis]